MSVVPDSIEPVEEWRTWTFDGQSLLSHNGHKWLPGEPMKATCEGSHSNREWQVVRCGMSVEEAASVTQSHNNYQSQMSSYQSFGGRTHYPMWLSAPHVEPPDGYGYVLETVAHDSPDENCTCGIYAGRTPAHCPAGDVLGKVKMWGKIVPGEKGSRAELAYPSELHVSARLANNPAILAYGVPIVTLSDQEVEAVMPSLGATALRPRRSRAYLFSIAANLTACGINLALIGAHLLG